MLGLIANEECEWLPSLAFVSIHLLWIWILDDKWSNIAKKMYPDYVFIGGHNTTLPPVDALLLSRITLRQYNINLQICSVSLVLSTTRLRASLDWIYKYWRLCHMFTGGSTNSEYTLYSLHQVQFVSIPSLELDIPIPRVNICRVINTTASGGCEAVSPSTVV